MSYFDGWQWRKKAEKGESRAGVLFNGRVEPDTTKLSLETDPTRVVRRRWARVEGCATLRRSIFVIILLYSASASAS